MADTKDLKSFDENRESSNLSSGTILLRGIPIHVCDKMPSNRHMLWALVEPFHTCPWCGKKL